MKERSDLWITITIATTAVLLILSTSLLTARETHVPIFIAGDGDFTSANGVVAGTGTENDPYIIESWAVDASTAHGIRIENTTAYFVIRNCVIENGGDNYHGIYLENVTNGRVENCLVRDSDNGIWLHSSSFITLENNTCENNSYGLSLIESENITMRGNVLSNNFFNFHMDGTENSHFEHDIAHSDTTNGKAIMVLYGERDQVIAPPTDVGYLALIKCDNILVENLTFAFNGEGVFLIHTTNSQVRNCTFENNSFGIRLWHSSNNAVVSSAFRNNARGIRLWHSSNNLLDNNICVMNSFGALLWPGSDNNTIINNTFENNCYGICLHSADNNTIHHNYLLNNTENNARDDGINAWDDGSEGNWWSDWQPPEHPDANGDGIVDEPRPIACGGNQDNYPLVLGFSPRAVEVQISPSYQSDVPGAVLNYTVTVVNEGSVSDTYNLTATDSAGWSLTLAENSLENVSPGENRTTTLTVTIPGDAIGSTEDNIAVTATSQTDNTVSDNASCIAHVTIVYGIDMSISPGYQSGSPGSTLTYTVTVKNTGNVTDSYTLVAWDDAGWLGPWTQELLNVPPGENGVKLLNVTIPDNAMGCTVDNVTVVATSQGDNTVTAENTCTAHVSVIRGVEVGIIPSYQSGGSCTTLDYTVILRNAGNVDDVYDLSWIDSAGWGDNVWLEDNSLWVRYGGENSTSLHVHIPENAEGCTEDNITVTVISRADNAVTAENSCIAHVSVARSVVVSITPGRQGGEPCNWLGYAVTIRNTGNVDDVYDLVVTDNLGWDNIWLEDNSLSVVRSGGENSTTLHVHIPENVGPGASDNIILRVTSQADNTIGDNASCIAYVPVKRSVDVLVTPPVDNKLVKDVIVSNRGNVADSYILTVEDNAGWVLVLAENLLENVSPGENRGTKLSITIPSDTRSGTVGNILVTATSVENTETSDTASAQVTAVKDVEVSISPKENSGLPGETLTYIATIKNTGNTVDNYYVTKIDELGWLIGGSFLWIYDVVPGSFASVRLEVTIPENVETGAEDLVTVTATSQTDNTVSDNDTCIAAGPDLSSGWALISFYDVSENDTPNNLFAGVSYTMYYWTGVGYASVPSNEPVELGVGYWVYVGDPTTVTTTGVQPENFSINLIKGWNLIGFPVTSGNTTPANLFENVSYTMYYWTGVGYASVPSNEPVELGVGYWVYVDENMTVTVPL